MLQATDEVGGFLAGEQTELGRMILAQPLLLAPQLGDQLLTHQLALLALRGFQLLDQLAKGDVRVHHHGLHVRELLQGLVDPHRIKDAEVGLVDCITKTGGAADHLVVEDAAVHAPQEHDVADCWHIHAGAEQIHRDGHIGKGFVLVAANQLLGLITGTGDLGDCIIGHAAVALLEGLFE